MVVLISVTVTYYITALSQYSDLAPCAQSAVSYEFFSVSRIMWHATFWTI